MKVQSLYQGKDRGKEWRVCIQSEIARAERSDYVSQNSMVDF